MRYAGHSVAHNIGMFDPVLYIILVRGELAGCWSDRLSGMAITTHASPAGPCMTLAGMLIDQAALQGVLKSLYDLGMPLLSVTAA